MFAADQYLILNDPVFLPPGTFPLAAVGIHIRLTFQDFSSQYLLYQEIRIKLTLLLVLGQPLLPRRSFIVGVERLFSEG